MTSKKSSSEAEVGTMTFNEVEAMIVNAAATLRSPDPRLITVEQNLHADFKTPMRIIIELKSSPSPQQSLDQIDSTTAIVHMLREHPSLKNVKEIYIEDHGHKITVDDKISN